MSVDKRLIEALEAGKVYSVYDGDYAAVMNISASGLTAQPNPDNPYGDTPIFYPIRDYGTTWAVTKEEIK